MLPRGESRDRPRVTRGGGWGLVVSSVFKTDATRRRRVGWVRFPHAPATRFPGCSSGSYERAARSERRLRRSRCAAGRRLDVCRERSRSTARARVRVRLPPRVTKPDTRAGRPSRRSARSCIRCSLPGYGQSVLDRPIAGALFAAAEMTWIAMATKSAFDLRMRGRTKPTAWLPRTRSSRWRTSKLDSLGRPVGATYAAQPLRHGRGSRARRTHLEDYYALLISNHLLAGAEAFVSAQLWDLPAHVSIRQHAVRTRARRIVSW